MLRPLKYGPLARIKISLSHYTSAGLELRSLSVFDAGEETAVRIYSGRCVVRRCEWCVMAACARMWAWRLHAYGALRDVRLESARVPALRAPDELLVRVAAASLNPLDVAMLGGYGSRALNVLRTLESGTTAGPEFPLVVGRDFAGTVECAGPAARLRAGARVWGVLPPHRPGAHAQFLIVKDKWVGLAPRALSATAAGGALYAALSACSLLRCAGLRDGAKNARVLLLGLGGVGQAALQLLAAGGAHVTVGCAGELAPHALALGAADVLDRHADDYEQRLEQGGPYAAVLDCAGLGGGAASARRWRFARYVTLSSPLLRATDARGAAGVLDAAATLVAQNARARTAARDTRALPPHVRWAYFTPNADDIEALRRLAERGRFSVAVERVFPWWEAPAAYERAAQGSARGKLVLDFTARRPDAPP